MITESRTFPYGLSRRKLATNALSVLVAVIFVTFLAVMQTGVMRYLLAGLTAIFIIFEILMLSQLFMSKGALHLSEDSVLISRLTPVNYRQRFDYSKIVRISEGPFQGGLLLRVTTKAATFEVLSTYFENAADYSFVRDSICSQSSFHFSSGADSARSIVRGWREAPPPLLRWTESDDWPRYRAGVVAAKPRLPRMLKILWFAARCLAVIMVPWVLLQLCGIPTASFLGFLALGLVVTAYFTLLYWDNHAHPERISEIVLRDDGLTSFSGFQTAKLEYDHFSGWKIVERQFKGRPLLIALLKTPRRVWPLALPDAETRDQFIRILENKKVPADSALQPSWE